MSELILPGGAKPKAPVEIRAERCETCYCAFFVDGVDEGRCRWEPSKMQFIPVPSKLGGMHIQILSDQPPAHRDGFCVAHYKPKSVT